MRHLLVGDAYGGCQAGVATRRHTGTRSAWRIRLTATGGAVHGDRYAVDSGTGGSW